MATHVRRVLQVARVNGTCEAQIQFPISCHFLRKQQAGRRGVGAGAWRGCGDAFCHAGTRARIFTCERINANSPDSPQTLLTFESIHFIAVVS